VHLKAGRGCADGLRAGIIGLLQGRVQTYNDGLEQLQQMWIAIRLNPVNANAFNNRGNAYEAKGALDRATADYDEAIRLDPRNSNAFYNRGNAVFDTPLVRQRRGETQ
jgi:tetratricopeptide (TPR) repeat protein